MRSPFARLLHAVLLVCCGLAPLAAQDFAIRLVRPVTVGDRYGVRSEATQENHMALTVDGQANPPRDEVVAVSLEAKAEVLAVTPGNRELKTRFTVVRMTRTVAGKTDEILPAGTMVVGERTGTKTGFTVGDGPPAKDIAQALGLVISLENDEGANDDAIFGTKERKKVGETWPVNVAVAAADFAAKGRMTIDAANINGQVLLAEQRKDGLRITASLEMKQVGIPLPRGMTVTTSAFRGTFAGVFPIDVTKRPAQTSMSMDGAVECAGKNGEKMVSMKLTMKQAREVSFTAP